MLHTKTTRSYFFSIFLLLFTNTQWGSKGLDYYGNVSILFFFSLFSYSYVGFAS